MGPGPAAVPGGRAPPTWRASSLDLGLFIELAAILKSLLFRKLGLGPKEMEGGWALRRWRGGSSPGWGLRSVGNLG